MSTTFAVKIADPVEDTFTTDVAFRWAGPKGVRIGIMNNELFDALPDDCPVIATDNTSQGIENIGDIRKVLTDTLTSESLAIIKHMRRQAYFGGTTKY